MIEIERKFRLTPDKKAQIAAELEHRYGHTNSIHQVDQIFLHGVDSFKNFKQGDAVIRLRSEGDITKLTYKRQINSGGDSLEHELEVESADTMQKILLAMGYLPVTTVDKQRIEAAAESATFALDSVKHLGDFLEIEVIDKDENNIAEHEAYIMSAAAEFGLTNADIEPKKYDMLMSELN